MSDSKSTVMVLTGPHAGETIKLGVYFFTEGRLVIPATAETCAGMIKYLGRCYQAFPLGSPELAAIMGEDYGQCETETDAEPGPTDQVQGAVQPTGATPGPSASDVLNSDDEGGYWKAGVSADRTERPRAEAAQGGEAETPNTSQTAIASMTAEALEMLDPDCDEHWTQDGRPAVAAVSAFAGPAVTRAIIERVASEFNREAARGQSSKAETDSNEDGDAVQVSAQQEEPTLED